jgi:hypothetical protein
MPDKKEFLFYDKPKAAQYWKRQTDFPKIFFDWWYDPTSGAGVELDAKKTEYIDGRLISLSRKDTSLLFDTMEENGNMGLQQREYKRRTDGVWMFINGEPVYITGDHYASLQWLPMLGCDNSVEPGSNYGQYYQFQRDFFYFFIICETIEYARGGMYVKPKKTGITQCASLVCCNRAMIKREKNIRMMSITESLCKDANFGFIKYALQKVPAILMPSRAKQNEGEVVFGPPNASRNPLKKRKETNMEYLNNWLCTVPTSRTAFDSFTNYIALIDEFPKIKENTYPDELFTTTLPTVIEGFKRKGTIFALSYVPEKTDRSFYESRQWYKDSKLATRKRNEQGEMIGDTKSKLICHTLTVQEGMFNCCDIYGKPVPHKIWDAIKQEKEDAKNDPVKLQAIQRQYPTNEQDPWMETGREDTLFDNLRLSARAQAIEELHSVGAFPYKDFNLVFEKEPEPIKGSTYYKFDGKIGIRFVRDDEKMAGAEHGKFKWFRPQYTPESWLDKYLNKTTVDPKTGLRKPNPDAPFFIAMDPTNWRIRKKTGKSSKNAISVYILPDAGLNAIIGKNVTNRRLMMSYLYRHNKPSDTLRDVIALVLLLGCMIQVEGNQASLTTALIESGLQNFVLMMNEDGALEPYHEHRKQKYFESSKETIDQYVHAGQEFLAEPFSKLDIDNIEFLDDLEIIQQLMMIKKEDTTDYDAAVAYLQGHMGIEGWLGWRRAREISKVGPSEQYRNFVQNMLH